MIPSVEATISEISEIMDRLNRLVLDARALERSTASDLLGRAWTAAYDARADLGRERVI